MGLQLVGARRIGEHRIRRLDAAQYLPRLRESHGLGIGSPDIDTDYIVHIRSFNFATTWSISSRLLCLLKENLTVTWLGLLLIARMTCDPCSAPLVQALPPRSEILLMSRLNNSISDFSVLGKDTLSTV